MYEPTPEDRFTFGLWTVLAVQPHRDRAIAAFRKALAETGLRGGTPADLTSGDFDPELAGARGYHFTHVNQLSLEHLLGVRG
ncbi:hypothetical protein [Nonomuraea helvata]|uniref:Uncharacterized protein n=1 Tax=Nonomuraea helvata TaxID=37484 RepID=A0ABV5SK74_9ACTN